MIDYKDMQRNRYADLGEWDTYTGGFVNGNADGTGTCTYTQEQEQHADQNGNAENDDQN